MALMWEARRLYEKLAKNKRKILVRSFKEPRAGDEDVADTAETTCVTNQIRGVLNRSVPKEAASEQFGNFELVASKKDQ